MFFVCPGCGEWSNERPVEGLEIVCDCGHRQPIRLLPLLLVTGASGTGKSTIAVRLAGLLTEAVVLDQDILWMPEMDTPQDDWRGFRSLWLRMAANIHQSGRPVLLFGSCDPAQYETVPERRYVGEIHTLALVCEETELRKRLIVRPTWRGSGEDQFIDSMLVFDRVLRALAMRDPERVTLLDTTHGGPEESVRQVADWARTRL